MTDDVRLEVDLDTWAGDAAAELGRILRYWDGAVKQIDLSQPQSQDLYDSTYATPVGGGGSRMERTCPQTAKKQPRMRRPRMHDERRDIETREDIERLVRSFYTRVFADPVLAPIFIDIAKMDLAAHIPVMCDFWENILFDARTYPGGMMMKHVQLHMLTPLERHHFQRWLDHWVDAVEERFAGPRANVAKLHASRVAGMMAQRFEQMPGGLAGAPRMSGRA